MGLLDLVGIILLGTLGTLAFKIISNDDKPTRLELIINDFFNSNFSTLKLTIYLALAAILVLMLKTLIQAFFSYKFNDLMARIEARIASNLVSNLIHSDFKRINKYNLSDYQYTLMIGINRLTVNVLTNSINLINDLFSTLLMSIFALYASPWAFLSAILLFGVIYIFINKKIINKARQLGEESVLFQKNSNATFQEILNAIKEIKVYNKEEYAVSKFQHNKLSQTLTLQKMAWLNGLIKYVLEIGILLIGLVVILALILTTEARQAVTVLTIFLAIGFRMIPNIQRIQNSGILFTAGHSATVHLFEMLKLFKGGPGVKNNLKKFTEIEMIKLKDVGFKHSDKGKYLFQGISLNIKKGEILGIIGPSGAGKSTLIDLIVRLQTPSKGRITFLDENGKSIKTNQPIKIGYVTQTSSLFGKNLFENVIFGSRYSLQDKNKVIELARKMNLQNLLKRQDLKSNSQLKNDGTNVSGGERQRISLIRSVYYQPSIYVFDEPTSALDAKNAQITINLLKEIKKDKIVIIVSHSKEIIGYCDRVLKINNGKVALQR
jgi:ABC-type multidrug transport system fused ATPase/permease subunit